MTNLVQLKSYGSQRRHSGFWGTAPKGAIRDGQDDGVYVDDDFTNFGIGATDKLGQYLYYIDTSNTVTQLATEPTGVVSLVTDATDNDAPILQMAGGTGVNCKIVSGTSLDLWWEARIRVGATLTEQAVFVGLAEEGCAADNGLISDNPDTDIATVMADKDYIGFASFTNAAPKLAFAYKKAGGTDQVIVASAHTLVASTWVKVGMHYNANIDRITAYVNGQSVGYFDVSDAGTTNFPSGEEMCLVAGFKNGSAGARSLDLDWWSICQKN